MLLNAIHQFCLQQGFNKTYWIAYSGGVDSHVLLSLMVTVRQFLALRLKAIHINHGMSQHAARWAKHCADVCVKYDVVYVERELRFALNAGESLEEIARNHRYNLFTDYLTEGDVLLTAHHQDDQAETILLQLMRGSGLKGLAAMPILVPFAKGWHARPLLDFSRAELQAYARTRGLQWVNDESNDDSCFTRNFIRHEILSRLKKRWPSASAVLSRSAKHCAEAQALLEDFSVSEWLKITGLRANTLSVQKLLCLDIGKQRLALRSWIDKLGYPLPSLTKIETIQQNVLTAKWDRSPCVTWQNVELRRYRDDLYLMPCLEPLISKAEHHWDLQQPLFLPGLGTLSAVLVKGYGLRADLKRVVVRFREEGQTVFLSKRNKHALKNLFQEWGVPPWERQRIPLIFVDPILVMAIGYYLDEDYAAKVDEIGYAISFGTTNSSLPISGRRGQGSQFRV